jgi:hypothetical protein
MTQGIPLAGTLREEVVVDVVEHEATGFMHQVMTGNPTRRRDRGGEGIEGRVERKEGASADQLGGFDDSLGCE